MNKIALLCLCGLFSCLSSCAIVVNGEPEVRDDPADTITIIISHSQAEQSK